MLKYSDFKYDLYCLGIRGVTTPNMDPKLQGPPMDLNKWQATAGYCSQAKSYYIKTTLFHL